MKLLKYVLVLMIVAVSTMSCVEEPIGPLQDEDLPITPPPPPPCGC